MPIPKFPTKVRSMVLAGVAAVALFSLLTIAVAVQWFRPSADVLVSDATTYISAPLGDDGLPDYPQAIQQYETIPKSLQENGAVPFWKAMGEPSLEPSHWDQISASLQIDSQTFQKGLSAGSTDLSDQIPTWVRQDRSLDPAVTVDCHAVLIHAATAPWRPEECNPLAEAIQHHHQQLEWLHDAASKPVFYSPPDATRHLQTGSVDWNLVLRYMNRRFDQMESILREPRRDRRWQAWQQLETERQAAWSHVQSQVARDVGFFSRQRRSQLIAEEIMDSSINQFGRILNQHHQLLARARMLDLAGKIVLHRLQHGQLPTDLDFDGPASESQPIDKQTIVYQRLESGFLLYDFGFNGRDDGGSDGLMANYRGIRLFGSNHDQPGFLKRILTRYGEADAVADDDTFSMLVSEHADDVALRVQPSPSSLTDAISDAIESP